jgi:hypothetical protein
MTSSVRARSLVRNPNMRHDSPARNAKRTAIKERQTLMDEDIPLPFDLPAVARKKVSAAFDGGRITRRWRDAAGTSIAAPRHRRPARPRDPRRTRCGPGRPSAARYPARPHLCHRLRLRGCRRSRPAALRHGDSAVLNFGPCTDALSCSYYSGSRGARHRDPRGRGAGRGVLSS